MTMYEYTYLAEAYGSGDYNNCSYTTSASCSTSGSTGNAGSSLANTGLLIAVVVTLACIIIFVAVLVRWWRRPRKTKQETTARTSNAASHDQNVEDPR
jgi:uncharacterized iron-regulated membrane protein